MLAVWAEPRGGGIEPDSAIALNFAVNKSLASSERMSGICSGEIELVPRVVRQPHPGAQAQSEAYRAGQGEARDVRDLLADGVKMLGRQFPTRPWGK